MIPKNGNPKGSEPHSKMDFLKWLLVLVLFCAGVYANMHFSQVAWAIRAAAGIVLVIIMGAIALQTAKGQAALAFVKASRMEMRKVVWPTRQETVQTSLIVVAAVIITALILWGIDSIFIWLVSSITR